MFTSYLYQWCVLCCFLCNAYCIVFYALGGLIISIVSMPRRIPDYADGYLNWNLIMTLGTFLTIISVVIVLINLNRSYASDG